MSANVLPFPGTQLAALSSPVLEAALSYARRGWFVLPVFGATGNECACGNQICGSPGKHPLTPNGLDAATTNETTIRNWYRQWPDANVAIRTGKISGIVVLDFDGPEGLKTAETLGATAGPTPRSITGSGGRHWIHAYPGFDVPNSTKKLPGMDVRGERGYIVAPPSMHACGNAYRWEEFFEPESWDPAPLPDTLLRLLAPEEKQTAIERVEGRPPADNATMRRARFYLEKMRPGISGDGGHTQTFRAAVAAVRGFGLNRAQALELMREYNARCVPPWSDDELIHKIDDALTASKVPDGYIVKRDEGVAVAVKTSDNWIDSVTSVHNRQFGRIMPIPDLSNAALFFRNSEPYVRRLRYDVFADRPQINDGDKWRELTDADVLVANVWLQTGDRECRASKEVVRDAITLVVNETKHHPVREYLSGLAWDGKPRIEDWLIRLGGAPDTRYTRAVSSKWLIQAVARVMRPGCRADTVLILEGAQGAKKSTAISALGGAWTSAMSNSSLGSKDALEQLRGRWIIEMAELDVMSKAEVSTAKDFITRTSDYYRPSYGHFARDFPRECVFAGTVNHDAYLKDETGGRRFWPVPIKAIGTPALSAERDQLWAEAIAKFQEGEEWWLCPEDEALARAQQSERYEADPWEEPIRAFLNGPSCGVGPSTSRILDALSVHVDRQDPGNAKRVARVMRSLGWLIKHTKAGNVWVLPAAGQERAAA